MKKYFILFAAFISFSLEAQKISWNDQPVKGLVYSITNREARKLVRTSNSCVNEKMLHTLVDSFDTRGGWTERPSTGHFLLLSVRAKRLISEYVACIPYQVFLLREYDALSVQILDVTGTVRTDARVKLGMNTIAVDTATKTYRVKDPSFTANEDVLSVKLNGFASYYNIYKHEVPPSWYPSDDYNDKPRFYSYLITDKNKYKPGEKVRFKSYALTSARTPLRKPLQIRLLASDKTVRLGKVEAFRPGSYTGEFILHDSLGLKLDRAYDLQLVDENGRIVSICNFRYEDYLLSGNRIDIKLNEHQYYPDTNILTIKATDVNGLVLKDARAEIVVLNSDITESFEDMSVLHDTLEFRKVDLDPSEPTRILIEPGLFGKTNAVYQVQVTIMNTDNERITLTQKAKFFYSSYELSTCFSGDSICFDLLNNNRRMSGIPVKLKVNNEKNVTEVNLPYKVKINPSVISYHFVNQWIDKVIEPRLLAPQIDFAGGIETDSFKIRLINPQKLPVSWYIYQGSELIEKGSGVEMQHHSWINSRTDTYYAELLYTLGGQDFSKRRQYEFRDSKLNVVLDIPGKVYPGQTTDATIHITNQSGEPVKDVDLTALAVNGKLERFFPDLPYYGSTSQPRPKPSTYTMDNLKEGLYKCFLNYEKWNPVFHLDSMVYYQFFYPGQKIFRFVTKSPDSTQFAPFVLKNGFPMSIHVIEVDHVPVYFSWTNQVKKYSFYVSSARKHQISIRMADRLIILDSMVFEKGMKTILSIDLNQIPSGITVKPMKNQLSAVEKSRYSTSVSGFSSHPGKYAYLEFYDQFFPVYDKTSGRTNIVAGPVQWGRATYTEKNGPHINFRYEGGYKYDFEQNVVYKLTPEKSDYLPKYLYNYSYQYDPITQVNDLMYTKDSFLKNQQTILAPEKKWITGSVDIRGVNSRLKITMPYDTTGITGILFIDSHSGRISSPYFDLRFQKYPVGNGMPDGYQSVVVLFENGNYLKEDSVLLGKHIQTFIAFRNSSYHSCDSASLFWLTQYSWNKDHRYSDPKPAPPNREIIYRNTYHGNVQGIIRDGATNEPLPGVCVVIKGTEQGVITDLDGHFSIFIQDNSATLQISFIGYCTEEIEVNRDTEVIMQLKQDICQLQEVVVVGYALQGRVSGLSSTYYTSTDAPSYIPPDEVDETSASNDNGSEAEEQLYRELLMLKRIRSDFSDVAFWEPKLFTDKKGESVFSVKFPDDITRWDALVYAMNNRLQTGTARLSIRSFKPVIAELHTPQFLTEGDSSMFLGKILNYSQDSVIRGKIDMFNGNSDFYNTADFMHFHSDFIHVSASGSRDSLTVKYTFTRNDGYFDGEERSIPVVKKGIDHVEGSFSVLKNGEQKTVKATGNDIHTLEITDSQLELYRSEIDYLYSYRYTCNEQLASRLIALINLKYFHQYENKKFRHDNEIRRIIARLLNNQNSEFFWSWWDVSKNTSWWISAHVLRALKFAGDAGYDVKLDIPNLVQKATYKFEFRHEIASGDIDLLHALAVLKAQLNYPKYIRMMDTLLRIEEARYSNLYNGKNLGYSFLHEKLLLEEIRQMTIPGYKPDIMRYKKESLLGEVFFTDNKPPRNWLAGELEVNLDAYRIIRNDSALKNLMMPMQLYFINSRIKFWNTYESSNLLLTVLPDLLKEGFSKEKNATLIISGKQDTVVSEFPYKALLKPGEELTVKKEAGLPVYVMNYVTQHITEAKTGTEGLKIHSHFAGHTSELRAAEPVDLIVEVEVEKDAPVQHVMIEVPLPAGCSYADKKQAAGIRETHREYFKEKTVIFCETLQPGKHSYTIKLLPRFTGSYFVNPAQVSLMYVPVVNANTSLTKINIVTLSSSPSY